MKDFEEMFGKDLDNFLEDSKWDDSQDGEVMTGRPKNNDKK